MEVINFGYRRVLSHRVRIFVMRFMSCVLLSVLLGALAAGCSSSQQTAAARSPAANSSSNGISADPRIDAILEKSCYTCHATGGSAPWYAAVSPTYLAAGSARNVLNFSVWPAYDAQKKVAELKSIAQSVSSGSMPPGDYTALDHSARLSEDDKRALLDWVSQTANATR
jgi:uncharacterized membrane protein